MSRPARVLSLLLVLALLAGLMPAGAAQGESLTLARGTAAGELETDGYRWDGCRLILSGLQAASLRFTGFHQQDTIPVSLDGRSSVDSLNAGCTLAVYGGGTLDLAQGSMGGLYVARETSVEVSGALSSEGTVVAAGTLGGTGGLTIRDGVLFCPEGGTASLQYAGSRPAQSEGPGDLSLSDGLSLRTGAGWVWDPVSRTLTLSDGCVLCTAGDAALTIPQGATLVVQGRALVAAADSGADGIVLESGASMSLADGAELTVCAPGTALILPDALELSGGQSVRLIGGTGGLKAGGSVTIPSGGRLFCTGALAAEIPGGLTVQGALCSEGRVQADTVQVSDGGALAAFSAADGPALEADSLTCAGGLSLEGAEAGAVLSGAVQLEPGALASVEAGGDGVTAGDTLTVESGASAFVTAGGDGLRAAARLRLDGEVEVDAGGDAAVSTDGSLTIDGILRATAGGAALRASGLLTSGETAVLALEAGGDGVVSGGTLTLNCDPGQVSEITAAGAALRSEGEVVLAHPGDVALTAGTYGIYAQGNVTVGGSENDQSHVTIDCEAYSIYSAGGNVLLQASRDAYFLGGGVFADLELRKTVSVADGAALFYGMDRGRGVAIVRKDYTLTGEHTDGMLVLSTIQVGKGYTFTIAGDAQVMTGSVIAGSGSRIEAQPGSTVMFNDILGLVDGETVSYTDESLDLTQPQEALPQLEGVSWENGVLTLSGAVLSAAEGPALVLPAGSTVKLEGDASRVIAGAGGEAAILCAGDLTLSGGALDLSGGLSGLSVGGSLRIEGTQLQVAGTEESGLSVGGGLLMADAQLTVRQAAGDGVSAGGRISAASSRLDIQADGTALRAGTDLFTDRTVLALRGGAQAVSAGGSISIDGLPEGLAIGGGSVTSGGVPVQVLEGGAGQTGGDGEEPLVETSTQPDGTVVTDITYPSGASVRLRETSDGTITAEITLPEGVEQAALTIPLEGAGLDTVALLTGADGTEQLLPKSAPGEDSVALVAEGSGTVRFETRAVSFRDVPADSWYADGVAFAAARGLLEGVAEGVFDPAGDTTRAMLACILHRLEGEPKAGETSFDDVPADSWYAGAVAWAADAGIVTGGDGGFAPEEPVTREALAAMLYRYARTQGLDTSGRADLAVYSDGGTVSPWAEDAVSWAVHAGLLNGSGGALRPGGTASRCEVAVLMQRMAGLLCQGI